MSETDTEKPETPRGQYEAYTRRHNSKREARQGGEDYSKREARWIDTER